MIERDIFSKEKGRDWIRKKGHMTKDRMPISHQLRWWIEWRRIWFFSVRFGRCRSCSPRCIHGSISLYFSPALWKSVHIVVGMACVRCSPQENFVSHSVVGFGHQPMPHHNHFFFMFFSFNFCSLASLVRYMPSLVINTSKPWLVNIHSKSKKETA